MLVYSRLEIIDPEIRFILMDSIPSMHMQVKLPSGDRVFVHFVHSDPPNPEFAKETTERDAEVLIVGREMAKREGPAWGSDHFPFFIELSLDSGAEAEQKEPDTTAAEGEQVDEKIEDGKQQA
ncbi:hypothetical protein [Marinobacter orientalis]|uniref:Uncharacterized protein n=1 Tax=Marinobacter orientalis TaxID=1928859 RepID=A0A7Y0RCT8_9GAMM|nr:hypothetical protein [Marinobacter orientalis]NMT63870.1 hypothetical protein [Marinobacter orientalis]TGX49971.1 hypothetical protein DIT72_09715 [Marinobacter orientalis]